MAELYLPPPVTQRTGSHCQFSNCAPAVGAWLQRGVSGGTSKPTPEEFRIKAGGGSGAPNPTTGCKTFFEKDLVRGLHAASFEVTLLEVPLTGLKDRIATPRRALFAIATDYEFWPQQLDCMNGKAGPDVNHMVGIVPGITNGKVKVMNPLCEGEYQDVPVPSLTVAAQKFATGHARDKLLLVRIFRPQPAGMDDAAAQIDDLKEKLAAKDDYIAAFRSKLLDLINEVP